MNLAVFARLIWEVFSSIVGLKFKVSVKLYLTYHQAQFETVQCLELPDSSFQLVILHQFVLQLVQTQDFNQIWVLLFQAAHKI